MPRAEANGIQIYYEIRGEGPPLVLINGLTANIDWWEPEFLDLLAGRFRLLLFDNRGSGRSDAPPEDYTVPLLAEDTADLMRKTGFERSHVFGLSLGGMIAQELVLNHPDMVDHLVLCSTFAGGESKVLPSRDVVKIMMDRSGTAEDFVRRVLTILFPQSWIDEHPDVIEDFLKRYMIAPTSEEAAVHQFMSTVTFDASDRLGRIESPTLVITGTDDVLVRPENSDIIAGRIPGARLVRFEGAGHGVVSQRAEEVAELVIGFLKG